MIDLQAAYPQQVIRVSDVSVSNDDPRFLFITGEDFRAVESVELNDQPSPSFLVQDSHHLLAELPDNLSAAQVHQVSVLSRQITVSPESLIRLRLGQRPSKVTGILKLMQLFVKVLFTTPGTDIFRKKTGGNMLSLLARNAGSGSASRITADFTIAVSNTVRQILSAQAVQTLPANERLLNAEVLSARFDTESLSLYTTTRLTSHAGSAALVNTEL